MGTVVRPPERIDRLLIGTSYVHQTLSGLALGGDREMLCYWVGAALPADSFGRHRAIVQVVAFPRIESGFATFRVVEGQIAQLTEWCSARELWILAQVHTHPTDEPHSQADECWPASRRPGFLSIVIPFFAQMSTVREPQWRVHEIGSDSRWREIDPNERIDIFPEIWLPAYGPRS